MIDLLVMSADLTGNHATMSQHDSEIGIYLSVLVQRFNLSLEVDAAMTTLPVQSSPHDHNLTRHRHKIV